MFDEVQTVLHESEGHPLGQRDLTLTRLKSLSRGATGTNSLIHGENLSVLRHLATSGFSKRVRCAYLDPPYNNGDSYRHYLDNMGHDAWLKSVVDRSAVIRELLTEDGSMWVSIDDSEAHYLKVALDSVFGRSNFAGTVVWERRTSRENRRVFSRNHEYILVYARDIKAWTRKRNGLAETAELLGRYKNPDNDRRGPWQSVSANVQDGHATASQHYSLRSPSGKIFDPPKGRCWIYTKEKMQAAIADGRVWFGKEGSSTPRLKQFLSERSSGITPHTLWTAGEVGTTASAKKHLVALFGEKPLFDTPKPEQLIRRILEISTAPGDLVLDPYLGSGTTAAVAHKLNRRYVGIEVGMHAKSHCATRLSKVIRGESGGISSEVSWTGGGGFDFYSAV